MKSSEKITVVIAVKNREKAVLRTLDSIARQTLLPARVIVVDNGSTDGTVEAVSAWAVSHPEVFLTLADESAPGAAAARNRGLQLVDTPFVMFFDSDDTMMPDHLERIERFAELVPDADLIYFDRMEIDDNGWSRVLGSDDSDLLRAQILDCPFATIGFAAATDLVRRAGAWDAGLMRWNDYELGVRLVLECRKARKLAGDPRVRIARSPDSISSRSYHESAHDLECALDRIALALRRAGKLHEVAYVYGRRAALAALYGREKAYGESRRLLDSAFNQPPGGLKTLVALQLINLSVRLTGHGSSMIVRLMMRKKKPKQRRKNSLATE
ncbi:MAG: glycosyltransferase family 2 protein [Paramuribaculum sp.]|nr:glycosyltransferase family 2 protein [Paramuribaculum sp.]